jgi:hypothetical protein
MYNYAGEKVMTVAMNRTGQINTKDLSRGIYYLVALSKKRTVISKKVVLE